MSLIKSDGKIIKSGGKLMKFIKENNQQENNQQNPTITVDPNFNTDDFDTLLDVCPFCGEQTILGECMNIECPSNQ